MSIFDCARQWELPAPSLAEMSDPARLSIVEVVASRPEVSHPWQRLWQNLQRLGGLPLLGAKTRRLKVCETVSLGEKRFVSIVEVDGVSLLVGGGSGNVALLTPLKDQPAPLSFQGTLENAWRSEESA